MKFAYSTLSYAVLAVICSASFANENMIKPNQQQETTVTLNPIIAKAEKEQEAGKTVYTKEDLEKMPNGKKSITEFLRKNTNVQLSRDANNAGTQASLNPEEISINGAPVFANKFLVNGVNTSNTFDPVGASADSNYTSFPTGSQTANINTDLLCSLEVLDSNVSAQHGDFQGGVISAKTCAPKTMVGKLHGSISYDYTTDAWSRFNYIDSNEETLFEDSQDTSHQREYKIQGMSGNLYGNISEQLGFNLNFAKRNSKIPVMSGFGDTKVKTENNNDSYGFTAFYTPNDKHKFQFGYDYFTYDLDGYLKNIINSNFTKETTTHSAFINAEHKLDKVLIEQNLNYRTTDSERQLDKNYSVIWEYAEGSKDWRNSATMTEGGVGGDLINRQSTISYDINAKFDSFKILNLNNQLKIGAEYKHNEGHWIRPEATYTYTTRKDLNGQKCAIGDNFCDEMTTAKNWVGQYVTKASYYGAGDYQARQDQWAVFFEDEIDWKKFSARIGLRGDYESLSSNFNIAPRINLKFKALDNNRLVFTGGFNKYYGSTYLITELDDKAYLDRGDLTRDEKSYSKDWSAENNYGWNLATKSASGGTSSTDLNTPYSVEKIFALNSQISNLNIELKWVNREFKDQIRQKKLDALGPRIFMNADGGDANTYTLSLSNIEKIDLLNTQHQFNFGLSYLKQNTLRGDFRTTDDTNVGYSQWVSIDGQEKYKSDLPTKDQPLSLRLGWDISAIDNKLKMNNFFNFRSWSENYTFMGDSYIREDGEKVQIMEKSKYASKFTWDTRLTYDWLTNQDLRKLTTGLTIYNVLNKKNLAVTENGSQYSEEGRKFIADVTFKF